MRTGQVARLKIEEAGIGFWAIATMQDGLQLTAAGQTREEAIASLRQQLDFMFDEVDFGDCLDTLTQ